MKELVEKRNDLITRAEDVLNLAKAEKRELTEAEAEELAEIRDNVRKIVETLKLNEEFKDMEKMEVKEDDTPKEEEVEVTEEQRALAVEQQERDAFENYLRGMVIHERAGELTPATSGSGIGLGGALIPETIVNYIIRKVYDICPILDKSQKFNVKGKLEVPYYPADSQKINVAYQTEFSPLSSSSGSFDTVELTGFLAGALTKISRTLINNVDFDIVGFVVDEMAYAIKRFIEHELLVGTSQKVTGLSTLSNLITANSATAVTAEEVIDLHDQVKDEFQQNAIWIMSPKTRTALRKLKSTTGYFLLNDDISTPFGTSILGKPVFVSDNMPDMEAGKVAIYYGDMRGLATKFNEEINIEVLREKYADEHAVGVIGWFEFDSKVIDEQQIAGLKMKGTPASE
jgi:HK97 family phage major capsid protein